jgi:hypothetical protein
MSPQRPCPLLVRLPGEIRTMILAYLLIPASRHPMIRPSRRVLFEPSFQQKAGLCLPILRTCRQLLHEGLPLLYGGSIIETDFSPAGVERFFSSIDQGVISMIRRLSLTVDYNMDEIEKSRDWFEWAKNWGLAGLLRDYASHLAGLQMLRLEFDDRLSATSHEYELYFKRLKLWDEYTGPETTEERLNELDEIAMHFIFDQTALRAYQDIRDVGLALADHVHKCLDHTGRYWIVFTTMPLRSSEEASAEVGTTSGLVWKSSTKTYKWHKC